MSITYRGSIYEKSWETHFYNTVVRTLHGDSGGLCESATATSRCTASPPVRTCQTTENTDVQGDVRAEGQVTRETTLTRCVTQ
jgi:hypothetical protein